MTGTVPNGARRGNRQDEPTLAVIARLAGVSAPTVSRVLNGRPGVSSVTRRQVESLLREHGYRRPSTMEPAPSVEVVFYGLESFLAVSILRGVEEVVRRRDLAVGFTEVRGRASVERSWTDQLLARRPVGVIAAHSYFTPQEYAALAAGGIPLVALDPSGVPPAGVPAVGSTNWSGGIAATRHLLELGHRRIAVIGGPVRSLIARARLDACRAALDTAGAPPDARFLRTGRFSFEDGFDLGRSLLSLADPPTAVLCGNDLQALGVYEAARQAGLAIPDDLSVVGFDDLECARWCGPPMTTVRQPFDEMGATAARLVLALAAGATPPHPRVELPTTLVVRGSTAPPARP
ncbi:substrate-binding domain-containing protein [Micromonospora sp. NPDC023956]|uniref:LacI family DNA-binding transcriptional regulator n=1 Tax=Micromonospora sp. NPDC023956 TaxID=3155722 RepID=UPI0034079EB6